MNWIYLTIASIFEIGWPIGMKIANSSEKIVFGWVIAILCMCLSGIFLWLAQKNIPIGTAYAVWTGMGTAGTFLAGILFFNESGELMRYFGVILIISGVIILKFAH